MQQTAHSVGRFAHPGYNAAAIGVKEGHVVADFGAGSGHYALEFASLVGGAGRVYAIDVQRNLLIRLRNEATRHGFANVETVRGDIEVLRGSHLADRAVDLVLMSNVLFQIERRAEALAEARRILRPLGVLAVIEWSDSFARMGPRSKDIVGKDEVLSLARSAGFDLDREFRAGAHHFGLLLTPAPLSYA